MNLGFNTLMYLAYQEALNSRDPSSQNGAVLLDYTGTIVSIECNQFPDGVEETDERWQRPKKYEFIEHAERNAVYAAARAGVSTVGGVLVCPWAACADCARAIVQAGLSVLVRSVPSEANLERWRVSCESGDAIMREAGVMIQEIPFSWPQPFTITRDGEKWSPVSTGPRLDMVSSGS